MSSSQIAVPTSTNSVTQRSLSDWVGAAVFFAIAIWTIVNGWIPVLRDSMLAAILVLPNWITPLLNGIGFIRRKPLLGSMSRWDVRLVAHVNTFCLPIYFALLGKSLHITATGLPFVLAVMVGVVAGVYMIWAAWALRNSWSIEPQARVLVTDGPFQFSRHPLYTSYLLRNLAIAVLYMDIRLAGVLLFWTVLLLYRVRCEERVLGECYPEYRQYRQQVWMFSPRMRKV